MNAERDGLARSVQVRLARHARAIGVDPKLVLTRDATERFLCRLSRSPHADRFVLNGALLLLAWLGETLRPTRDSDLLRFGNLDDAVLLAIFREVCGIEVEPDALTFEVGSVAIAAIRDGDASGGKRIGLRGRIGVARVSVQVDVGIGDAITPASVWLEYPSLLEFPNPRLRAYTRETVVAEKLHAIVLLGLRNSRMKDYFDVRALLREGNMNATTLAQAIAATFERRRTPLPEAVPSGLSDAFSDDETHQAQWAAFLTRNRLTAPTLKVVVQDLRERLIPSIAQARTETRGE